MNLHAKTTTPASHNLEVLCLVQKLVDDGAPVAETEWAKCAYENPPSPQWPYLRSSQILTLSGPATCHIGPSATTPFCSASSVGHWSPIRLKSLSTTVV